MTYPFLYVSSFTSPLTNYIPEVECIIAILNIEFIIEVHDHESDVFFIFTMEQFADSNIFNNNLSI